MKAFCKLTFMVNIVIHLYILITNVPETEQYRRNSHKVPFNITASTGITVDLKCKVRLNECGHFYSIEWYWQKPKILRPFSPLMPPQENVNIFQQNIQLSNDQNVDRFGDGQSSHFDLQELTSTELLNQPSKESERVFVYRHNSGVAKAENRWKGRAQHKYDTNRHLMRISLSKLKLEDQASYRCEITYKEPGRWFKDSCLTPQITKLNVIGPPTYVKVSLENDTEIVTIGGVQNGNIVSSRDKGEDTITSAAIIGPYKEKTNLILKCKAGGGRPVPEISWWNGNREVPSSSYGKLEHENGTGSTESEISILLQRSHLGKSFTCKVNSTAMSSGPILRTVYVDMDLPPITLDMIQPILETNEPFSSTNQVHHSDKDGITITSHENIFKYKKPFADVDEGGKISITCIAKGAKPQAHIYWNSDPPLNFDDIHEETKREENGLTFTTINTLTFEAERELTSLSCFASNSVLDNKKETPLKRATNIHVKFRPEIELPKGSGVIEALQDDETTIECNYNANPLQGTKIEWYKDGKMIHFNENESSIFSLDNQHPRSPKIKFLAKFSETDGRYSCSAENNVGKSEVIEIALVKVVAVPRVNLVIDPLEPVSELQNLNVTLICEEDLIRNDVHSVHSNRLKKREPSSLLEVKWYLDGELLKHVGRNGLPECLSYKNRYSVTTNFHCKDDPTKIIMVNVRRTFNGNYACKARNQAGWGEISQAKEFKVLYPPSGATVSLEPGVILKGNPFKIKCLVEDLGFPPARKVRWYHNGLEVPGHGGFILANRAAHVASAGNYTCSPYNKAGRDERGATASVKIYARPNFLKRLPLVTGLPFSRKKVQLKCVVECEPRCSISWYKNGVEIGDDKMRKLRELFSSASSYSNTEDYTQIYAEEKPANVEMNRLNHVESVLELDFDNLVGGNSQNNGINEYKMNEENDLDVVTYSCNSTSNSVGLAVRSSTQFRLHYPPKDITIDPIYFNITEGSRLVTPFTCHADAYPPAQYYWIFANEGENITRSTIGESSFGAELIFRQNINREQSGTYTCTAHNALGNAKANATLNVFYPPVCRVRKETAIRDGLKLRCDVVSAFPLSDIRFTWYHNNRILRRENGRTLYISKSYRDQTANSDNEHFTFTGGQNDRMLFTTSAPMTEDLVGTFACKAANIAGSGELCEISINNPVAALAGVEGSNGQGSVDENELNYTYIAFGGGAVVAILFALALLSILICRKRYGFSGTKYNLDNMRRSQGERNMDEDITSHETSKPTSALITQSANSKCSSRSVGHSVLHDKKEVDIGEDNIPNKNEGHNQAQNITLSVPSSSSLWTNKTNEYKTNLTKNDSNIDENCLELPMNKDYHNAENDLVGGKIANYNRSSGMLMDDLHTKALNYRNKSSNGPIMNGIVCSSSNHPLNQQLEDSRSELVDYQERKKHHNSILGNNSGKLIYNKCSDGENSVSNKSCRNNNIMGRGGDGDNVVESNVNNIIQDCSGGCSVGVMNNNTNNGEVLSFTSHGNPDAVGVTFNNTSSTIDFHKAFDKESSANIYVNDKYISEISKSNILRHENNHYLSSSSPTQLRRQHLPPDHYLHQTSNSGPRYSEQFINGIAQKEERVVDEDDNDIVHNLNKRVDNDKREDRGSNKGGGAELNINDCSTLPTYTSTFKSAQLFPQLQPKRPQVKHWSTDTHPSHIISHGTTADFDDFNTSTEEYQSDTRGMKMTTFTIANPSSNVPFQWKENIRSLPEEKETNLIDYSQRHKSPKLYTRSIDRREVMRRNHLIDYPQNSDSKLPSLLQHNISDMYHGEQDWLQPRGDCNRYNAVSTRICDATLPRNHVGSYSRNYKSTQNYNMTSDHDYSPNSVFRSRRGREDTWLV